MGPIASAPARPSVAAPFPYELVEEILIQIPLLDLVVISSHLPPFWRAVFESSKELTRFLAKTRSLPGLKTSVWTPQNEHLVLRCKVNGGVLLTCRHVDTGDEGFIFIKDATRRRGPRTIILDPAGKITQCVTHPRFVYPKQSKARFRESIHLESFVCFGLRDLKGNLVVEHSVDASPHRQNDPLVHYLCGHGSGVRSSARKRVSAVHLARVFNSGVTAAYGTLINGFLKAYDFRPPASASRKGCYGWDSMPRLGLGSLWASPFSLMRFSDYTPRVGTSAVVCYPWTNGYKELEQRGVRLVQLPGMVRKGSRKKPVSDLTQKKVGFHRPFVPGLQRRR